MATRLRISRWIVPVAAVALLAACTTPTAPDGPEATGISGDDTGGRIMSPEVVFAQPAEVIPAPGEVHGVGTVIQQGDNPPEICFGAVRESYPIQCSGPEILGWDWESIDGHDTASTVTWGAYAVTGTWDGERFTLTNPPTMLALYDPMAFVDPYLAPTNSGSAPTTKLVEIQAAIDGSISFLPLTSHIENGYLFVSYIYDDGRLQRYLDAAYGADVVVVRSVLQDLSQ